MPLRPPSWLVIAFVFAVSVTRCPGENTIRGGSRSVAPGSTGFGRGLPQLSANHQREAVLRILPVSPAPPPGGYDRPPQLRPAWQTRGDARPWSRGAAGPRPECHRDHRPGLLGWRHAASKVARYHRGSRAGHRVQWRRHRSLRHTTGLTQPSNSDGALVFPARRGAPLTAPSVNGPAEARCLLLPPRLSAGETQQLTQQIRTAHRHYSIGHINARSLAPRLNEICHLIHSERLDILCVSETWLSEDVLDAVLIVPGYKLFRCDRSGGRRGGGVAILVSSALRVSRLHDTSDGETGVEALWLSVGGAGRATVVVGAVYRPPGVLSARLRAALRGQFEMALAQGKPVYALGDFNVNLLTRDTADFRNFNLFLNDLNLTQVVVEPTHPHPVPSLLDLAITSIPAENLEVSVLPHLVADHYPHHYQALCL